MRLARPQMRAFTIVELLAVIMIMAILMAVAMKALKVDPTQAACSQIAAQLRMARDHAIAKRMYVEVAVYRTGDNFAMTTYQSSDAANFTAYAAAVSFLPSSAMLNGASTNSVKVIFKPNGSLLSDYKTGSAAVSSRANITAINTATATTTPITIGAIGIDGSKPLTLNKFTGKASFW